MPVKQQLISSTVAIALSFGLSVIKTNVAQANIMEHNPEFVCLDTYDEETDRSIPTTAIVTDLEKYFVIKWTDEYFKHQDPLTRCQTETERFQEALDRGKLGMLTNGKMNGKNVICVPESAGGDCEHLLIELHPKENSLQVLNKLKSVFDGEQVGPIKHSSSTPQVYYGIDINNVGQ